MKFFKLLAGVTGLIGILLAVALAWAVHKLSKDQPLVPRPTVGPFAFAAGVPDGSAPPDAYGYVIDSAGRGRIVPPLAPEKPQDIHTAQNYQTNFAIRSCFWPGPRARNGVFTHDANSFHFENQFPDTATTYIPTAFRLPEGARLVIRGEYPHMRHWNFNTYNAAGYPQDALSDSEIDPDAGSSNPFRAGVPRDVAKRNYTLSIVSGAVPPQRARNTLYTNASANTEVFLWMRNYVPDHSKDYVGSVALPSVDLVLADGQVLRGEEACKATDTAMRGKQLPPSLDPRSWTVLSLLPWLDADNVAASPEPVQEFKAFFNRPDTLARIIAPALASRHPEIAGGWWSNKATRYGYVTLSRNFGTVYVVVAKAPTTPRTWNGERDNQSNAQMRYMSICSAGSATAAITPDCLYDEQIARTADSEGRFVIVATQPRDRPANATEDCGVSWLSLGNGDGVVSGSSAYATLINRHTLVNASFPNSWFAVQRPGEEQAVMGDYLPHLVNLKDKSGFETLGCPVDKSKLYALTDTFRQSAK